MDRDGAAAGDPLNMVVTFDKPTTHSRAVGFAPLDPKKSLADIKSSAQALPDLGGFAFSGGTLTGQLNPSNSTTQLPIIDPRHPAFGNGTTIMGITLSGILTCTGKPTVIISAPTFQSGTQAKANVLCNSNGRLYAERMINEGGGYDSSATVILAGGGVSGVVATPVLRGKPGIADPTGVECSDSAIQSAISYAVAQGAPTQIFPSVHLYFGKYKLCAPLNVPTILTFMGDGKGVTSVVVSGNFPAFHAWRDGNFINLGSWTEEGGLYNMSIFGTQELHTTDLVEGFQAIGYSLEHLEVVNSGGTCIHFAGERLQAHDIHISACRWPWNMDGVNEGSYDDLIINSPGFGNARGTFAYGVNAVNGVGISTNWTSHPFSALSTDGAGGIAATVANPTAPIVAGQWEAIAGVTDITAANGYWQATKVLNNCSVASPPYTSASTCTTGNSGSFIVIATLTSGTPVPCADWQCVKLINSTTATPAAGTSSGLESATWKPGVWPQWNPAIMDGSQMAQYKRASVKELTQAACFESNALGPLEASGFYCEGFARSANNPGWIAYGQRPYTTLNAAFSGTNCSASAPCPMKVGSFTWFTHQWYYAYPSEISTNPINLVIMPCDFNTASNAPSTCNSTVQQNQFEIVSGAFSQSTGQFMVTTRGLSGSTAPANTAWANTSLFGTHVGASASVASPATLEVHDVHTNPINASTSPRAAYAMLSFDGGAFPSCEFCSGVVPDNVVNFPPGTAGQNSSGNGSLTIGPQSSAIATMCNAATEFIGRDCAKVFTNGSIMMYGQATPSAQSPETATDIMNCSDYTTSSYPVIFAQYPGGKNSAGVFVDETTGTYLINNMAGGTGPCFFKTNEVFKKQTVPGTEFGTELDFYDLVAAGNGTNPTNKLRLFGSPGTRSGMEWQAFNGSGYNTPYSMIVSPTTGQGQLKVSQVTLNTGSIPSVALGNAAGTGPTGETVMGGNMDFTLQFVAGTSPLANGILGAVTFTNGPMPGNPTFCTGLPMNAATQRIGIAYGTSLSRTGFVLNIGATALTAGQTYLWGVSCN